MEITVDVDPDLLKHQLACLLMLRAHEQHSRLHVLPELDGTINMIEAMLDIAFYAKEKD